MPWFKVDDNLAMHAKAVEAGNAALGLWVRAGSWASQQLTDGFVPSWVVRTMGTPAQAKSLVRARLWREVDGGYSFWQWEDRQPTREAVEADRAAARERQRARRSPNVRPNTRRDSHRDSGRSSDEVTPGVTGGVTRPRPDPTRPDPSGVPPEHPGETPGGASPSVTREPSATGDAPRCPRHLDHPADGPCGPCGDARRAFEARTRDVEQRRRDAGPVVGGLECVQHPGEPAGRCGRCTATAVPMPTDVRDELRRRRQQPPRAS